MPLPAPPAAAEAAVAPAARGADRPVAAFLGADDDVDDSDEGVDEETLEDDFEEEEVAAAPNLIPNLNGDVGPAVAAMDGGYVTPQSKRQRTEAAGTGGSEVAAVSLEAKKPLAALEDSRRLFQRLWTDEDEIVILQGFLDFSSSRRGGASAAAAAAAHHHHDTGPFYDQIKARLELDFNKNQLVEKLRRLKKKFRNVMNRMSSGRDYSFKSPHDQATFELSRQIWGNSIYSRGGGGGGPDDDDDDVDLTPHPVGGVDRVGVTADSDRRKMRRRGRKRSVAEVAAAEEALILAPEAPVALKVSESHVPVTTVPVPNVIEETVRSCLSPMFKELLCCAVGGRIGTASGGLDRLKLSLLPLHNGCDQVNLQKTAAVDEKWRKQQILELEVFSKRIELVQEQIKLLLKELRSAG